MSHPQEPHDEPVSEAGSVPLQPRLFDEIGRGKLGPHISSVGPLQPESRLPVARYWYRRYLEQAQHPSNTVSSYLYDLSIFEQVVGPKPIAEVTSRDIAHYLGEANSRSTRKRRLTSVSGMFKWLVNNAKMLERDPTESFYPDHIPLKTPRPLFPAEQQAFMSAAQADSSRAAALCWLMLNLGLSRGEVLQLRRDHLDLADPQTPLVYVFYENVRWRDKERKLQATPEFVELYDVFLREYEPEDRLFVMLPQSVNKLTERVARAAGISKHVSPQSLRDTYAVERAKAGADEVELLALLGLADDPRNRMSVRRYIKLAAPAVNASAGEVEDSVGEPD
jgi:integrase/recombinase XerD